MEEENVIHVADLIPVAETNSPGLQFDTTRNIVVALRTEASGRMDVSMKWPSDALWEKWGKSRKLRTRILGRGTNESDAEVGPADLDLYNAARNEGSPDLTEAEATLFVSKAALITVLGLELGDTEATVKLRLMNEIEVTHQLRIPTAKQASDCTKAATKYTGLPHGMYLNTHNFQPTGKLWDELGGRGINYVGSVPILHKDSVMRNVMDAMEREVAGGESEKGF